MRRIIESEITHSNDFRDQLMQFGMEIIGERAANIAKEPSGHDGDDDDDRVMRTLGAWQNYLSAYCVVWAKNLSKS